MQTLTRRQEHAANLAYIAELSGESYWRRMTFKEADSWLNAYEYYTDEGYPHAIAVQYAWDHYYAARKRNAWEV